MRTVLTLSVVLLFPAGLLAEKGKPRKPNHDAEIKALEQKKKEVQAQEKTHLNQIENQAKAGLEELSKNKSQSEKAERDKLEAEKHQTLKRVEERYAYILTHDKPLKVWGQLDHEAKVLRGVHQHLARANPDYGGKRVAAMQSLDVAATTLQERLTAHRWTAAEKEATVLVLQTAERDLQQALAFSAARWGPGTPPGMPESQATSNQQLATALTTLDNVRHLVLYAQWEEGVDAAWAGRMKKQEAEEKQKVKLAYDAKLKAVDKVVSQHVDQRKQELTQKKQQAVAQAKAQYQAMITQIDNQIKQLKK